MIKFLEAKKMKINAMQKITNPWPVFAAGEMGVKYLLDSSGEGILMMGSPLISRRMLLPNSSSWKLANLEKMAIQQNSKNI